LQLKEWDALCTLIRMKIRTRRPYSSIVRCSAVFLVGSSLLLAQSARKNNPTSKMFVADLTGESQIDNGERIQPLEKNGVVAPEGSIIETKSNATDSLVLSNGTALYVASDTKFEVKRFLQQPFAPNRADLEEEPSVSQTLVRLARGGIGICTSRLVAGSSMIYETPQAKINIRGRRLMIETDENETRVSLLEGDVTVIGDNSSETLRPGQQAIVRKTSPDSPAVITVQSISDTDSAKLDDLVALACISRRTVFFESVDRGGANGNEGPELVPVRTAPAAAPTQFTVSPSRING
jgi:hypothetical protein